MLKAVVWCKGLNASRVMLLKAFSSTRLIPRRGRVVLPACSYLVSARHPAGAELCSQHAFIVPLIDSSGPDRGVRSDSWRQISWRRLSGIRPFVAAFCFLSRHVRVLIAHWSDRLFMLAAACMWTDFPHMVLDLITERHHFRRGHKTLIYTQLKCPMKQVWTLKLTYFGFFN